jgi:hypothetical protein
MIRQKIKRYKALNYSIAILAILAANPFYSLYVNFYLLVFLAYLLLIAIDKRVNLIDRKIFTLLVFVYSLVIIQGYIYEGFSLAAAYLPLLVFYIPFLIFRISGISFFKYFINVLYVISIYTSFLWLLQSFSSSFDNLLRIAINSAFKLNWTATPRSLFFFTPAWNDELLISNLGVYRNSGLFHEPGAYAVFLIVGIVMNALLNGKIFDRKNIVFMICTLSTFSTAGYLTLFIIVSVFLYKMKFSPLIRLPLLLVFIIISLRVFQAEEFLQQKIATQYEEQTYSAKYNLGSESAYSGRFFAFLTSWNLFKDHPIFGRGIIFATSEKAAGEMHEGASYNYGFIGIFATYGLFFGLYYLFYIYAGIKYLGLYGGQKKFLILTGFITINLELLTQVFALTTVIVTILIVGLYAKKMFISEEQKLSPS